MPAVETANWSTLLDALRTERGRLELGGGTAAIQRQHEKGRLTARERIAKLLDPGTSFLELEAWAGWQMYVEWGGSPSASVVTGIGRVSGRDCLVIANDATVKAGAFFPMTTKKVLRAQRVALLNRLPLVYLVDSAGVFLPLQDEVFPDEDDFGRIFRNNAVLSAAGVPQLAAIMGNCVAGGAYLPVLSDKIVMTAGSGLYLAGPALVKSSIGQEVAHEDLGGMAMHAAISGTIDFEAANDEACLDRLRSLAQFWPDDSRHPHYRRLAAVEPARKPDAIYDIVPTNPQQRYEFRDLLECVVDAGSFVEYKQNYGKTLVCGYARLGGYAVGIIGNQHHPEKSAASGLHFGGVVYHESADKGARFVMDCNQNWLPLVFFQDVYGFMVGRDSEQQGIIRSGAKLVNAIANSRVPKLTVIVGGSFGAGNYALCGKAFDPRFIWAWPTAKYAVMGGAQAGSTLLEVQVAALKRQGHAPEAAELEQLKQNVVSAYEQQTDVRYAAARGWVDGIVEPADTRAVLIRSLDISTRHAEEEPFRTGVLQV